MVAPFPQAGAFAPDVMNSGDQIRKYQRNNDFWIDCGRAVAVGELG